MRVTVAAEAREERRPMPREMVRVSGARIAIATRAGVLMGLYVSQRRFNLMQW